MNKILIVDDDARIRHDLRKKLQENGFEVCEAVDGKDGLRLIDEISPDLIIIDIVMPEMDGIEAVRTLVRSKARIPIIAMTEKKNQLFLEIAVNLGVDFGILKPIHETALLTAVQKSLMVYKTYHEGKP